MAKGRLRWGKRIKRTKRTKGTERTSMNRTNPATLCAAGFLFFLIFTAFSILILPEFSIIYEEMFCAEDVPVLTRMIMALTPWGWVSFGLAIGVGIILSGFSRQESWIQYGIAARVSGTRAKSAICFSQYLSVPGVDSLPKMSSSRACHVRLSEIFA